MRLRILIADDEAMGRQRLRQLSRADPTVEVIGEAATGTETVNLIRDKSPDIVFLDIRMPELDGFGVLKALNGFRLPLIIFVTAHDQYAVRAFEANAVDYLLKPFDRERFQCALERVRQRLQHTSPFQSESSLINLLSSLEVQKPLDRLTIKSNGRLTILKTTDIHWICAADNYVELHVGDTKHLLRMTLTALAERLPADRFVRVSRSCLVNADRIKQIQSKPHGDYVILLQDGTRLTGSRNFRKNLPGLIAKEM
jgi:two-component system LytT family response regulator